MFLNVSATSLHEPRRVGVVLRKLVRRALGEGGRGPTAALQGPLQLRRDRVVEAPIDNFHHVQLGSDPRVVDAAAVGWVRVQHRCVRANCTGAATPQCRSADATSR